MKTKLLLSEDSGEVLTDPVPEEKIVDFNINSFITELIKNKWEQVDNINGMILTIPESENDVVAVLKEIISDDYIHIGQLEKIIQSINPEAQAIDSVVDGELE